jgi:ionotropic glutamate receptor
LQQTTDPAAIELYNTKIKGTSNDSGFYEPRDGLELVRRGGFAFHVETSTAYPIIEETFTNQEICELEEVQMYRTQPMHTNLQKNSPFREMMNYW